MFPGILMVKTFFELNGKRGKTPNRLGCLSFVNLCEKIVWCSKSLQVFWGTS